MNFYWLLNEIAFQREHLYGCILNTCCFLSCESLNMNECKKKYTEKKINWKNKILLKINLYFCQFCGRSKKNSDISHYCTWLCTDIKRYRCIYMKIQKGFFWFFSCECMYMQEKIEEKIKKEKGRKQKWNMQSSLKLKFPCSAIILPHFYATKVVGRESHNTKERNSDTK